MSRKGVCVILNVPRDVSDFAKERNRTLHLGHFGPRGYYFHRPSCMEEWDYFREGETYTSTRNITRLKVKP